jgi:Family of unknown function (DUF6136)
VTPTYQSLRTAHFRFTLKSWFKGLDKALIAIFAVLQFILTAIVSMLVYGLAQALNLLQDPNAQLWQRISVIAVWQFVSFVLLRALREATFMPQARAFFDSLPVRPVQKLRADLTLALFGYSVLWLPVAWTLANSGQPSTALPLVELVLLSLCINLTLLRGAARGAWLAFAAIAVFAVLQPSQPWARFACAACAGFVLWRSYLPGRPPLPRARHPGAFAGRMAIGSGLVIPLLAHELRSNLLVRLGFIASTLGACLIVIHLRTSDASTASVVIFVAASATLALYSLPALCRNTLLGKLHFLAGHPVFAQRMRLAAYLIPIALFAAALAIAWPFDRSGTAQRDASMFSALFAGGIVGARLGMPAIRWIMPLCCMLALIIMSAML